MDFSDIAIIATGPHRFHGAGQIMSQYLCEFSKRGCEVVYVGLKKPFLFKFTDDSGILFKCPEPISASFYQTSFKNNEGDKGLVSQDHLLMLNLSESIVKEAILQHNKNNRIIIWGSYLFPSAYAAFIAKKTLSFLKIKANLWITPTGSDVWEIGPQLSFITRQLLNHPQLSAIITYTPQFAKEIKERYQVNRKIETIYPIIDFERFYPLSDNKKIVGREKLGISKSSFVISSHSNMRPVKCPQDVIYIAKHAARFIDRKTTLLMIGPKISLNNEYLDGRFVVVWVGVVENVERYIQVSDVELNCSKHDSFNLSLAESMACGLTCVTTDVVGIGNEIINSNSGHLFPYEPADGNANSDIPRYNSAIQFIVRLSQLETMRKEYGMRAYEHSLATFNSDKIMNKFIQIFNS